MLASKIRVAGITGAGVVIVAVQSCWSCAQTGATHIPSSAFILVVAATAIIGMSTTGRWITGVVGAAITVIAIQHIRRGADLVLADITRGAHIGVGAGDGVCGMGAAGIHVTGVIGADICVITVEGRTSGLARAGDA